MQEDISCTLQKLSELNVNPTPQPIEIDLMLEYTRKLYMQLQAMQQPFNHEASNVVHTEIIETILPEETEEKPVIEIKPAELVQQMHISTKPEPTLEDLIPSILEQAPDTHTSIPPIANVPEEFIPQILTHPENVSVTPVVTENVVSPLEKADSDIRKLIGINDKYQYISELFGNDKETYEIVLTRLNKFDSYADAVTWMDEVHTENRWDDEHPTVISFYDVMSQFFASR